MMNDQGVLENSQTFAGGCGCLYCCGGEDLQQARYEALLYEQALISNFADAVITEPDDSTLTVTTQRDANLQSFAESQQAPVSLAAVQAGEPSSQAQTIPLASVQAQEAQALPEEDSIFLAAVQQESAIAFTDVTRSAGLQLPTQTWGSAVGDYDGDGFVDIWLNRHQLSPILYRNQGDGTFRNVTNAAFPVDGDIRGDFHGSAFVDIDNDGDQDLLQLAGGDQGEEDDNPNKESKLFINTNGEFRSEERGVGYLIGRGRVGVLLDANNDSRLDYVFTGPSRENGDAPPSFFQQQDNETFINQGPSNLDINVPAGTFGLVSDLTGDGQLEFLYAADTPRLQIYRTDLSTSDVSFQEITDTLLPEISTSFIQDVVVGDFNGDGEQDLFIVRQGSFTSGVREDGNNRSGRARLLVPRASQRGISINTTGNLSLNFQGDPNIELPQFMQGVSVTPSEIRIGPDGVNPDSLVFEVNQETATGRPDINAPGVYIWYEETEMRSGWKIALSATEFDEVSFLYESDAVIASIDSELEEGDPTFPINPPRRLSSLLIREGDRFVERIEGSGLEQGLDEDRPGISASNAVSGDFDNDGDLDLYVVQTDITSNLRNIFYENQGDGTFVNLGEEAGGASGAPDGDRPIRGLGDGASVSDFDNDGDLDLFVTNGDVAGFRRPFLIDGSSTLFRNDQNSGNHFVLFDLVGTESNRDAVGAQVRVTIDGETQIREQNGGVHNRSQNDTRLHFGLGQSTQIDRVEIRWPSGQQEVLTNLAVDQIFRVVEGSGMAVSIGGGAAGGNGTAGEPPEENTGGGNTNPPTVMAGTTGADTLTGTDGRDTIRGRAGNDTIAGLDGNDNLLGNGGRDVIDAGAGDDLIVGGSGEDVLTGGAGQDRFLFNAPSQVDTLNDFEPDQDVLRLKVSRFGGGLSVGNLSSDQFHIGNSAVLASHRIVYDSATGDLFFDADGSGTGAAFQFATLAGLPNLTASDIELV